MNLYLAGKLFTSTSLASSAQKCDGATKLSPPAVAKSLALSLSMTVARTGAMWSEEEKAPITGATQRRPCAWHDLPCAWQDIRKPFLRPMFGDMCTMKSNACCDAETLGHHQREEREPKTRQQD